MKVCGTHELQELPSVQQRIEGQIKPTSKEPKEVLKVTEVGGRLEHFSEKWGSFTQDKLILSVIRGHRIPFVRKVVQQWISKARLSGDESKRVRIAINSLFLKGSIEECEPTEGQFLSSYFLIPKSDGTDRFYP